MKALPVSRSLNAAILGMAARLFPCGFDVSPNAPERLSALNAMLGHPTAPKSGARLTVFNGGSTQTIFADDEVNFAFRAWHDWTHWRYQHNFTLIGETATATQQIRDLYSVHGRGAHNADWHPLLWAEVVGQREYYERHRRFIADQRGFNAAYRADPAAALSRLDW
jgi:hypothetical protein